MVDAEITSVKASRRGAFFAEAAWVYLLFFHFFPGSMSFVGEEASRIWPLVLAFGGYIAARWFCLRHPAAWIAWPYYSAVLVWQALVSRVAFAVSWWGYPLVAALAVGHALLRRRYPKSNWAAASALLVPIALIPLGCACLLSALLTLAIVAAGALLLLAAEPRRLAIKATALLAFALGWQMLFAGFYLRDPAGDCAQHNALIKEIRLAATDVPQPANGPGQTPVNLVEPGCEAGSYLVATRSLGLFFLDRQGYTPLQPLEQVFGMVRRCGQNQSLGVSWESRSLLTFDLAGRDMIDSLTGFTQCPLDGLVEAGDELAAVTDTCSDIYLFDRDGKKLQRMLPGAGARVILYDAKTDRLLTVYNWHVRAVDRQSGRIVADRFLGSWEIRLALDEQHRRLYAVSFFTGLLFVLDADTLAIKDVHPVPLGSRYLLYHTGENALYLTDFLRGNLTKIDAETLAEKWTRAIGRMPRRLRTDADGALLVGSACGPLRIPQ